jgi:hypothetical protein
MTADGWEVDLNARLEQKVAALEAALAERDRMLRLAWSEGEMLNRVHGYDEKTCDEWLADLRARSGEQTP